MFCKHCGDDLPTGATYCAMCGRRARFDDPPPYISKKAMLLAAIAAAVSLGGIALSFLPKSKSTGAQDASITVAAVTSTATPSPSPTPTPKAEPSPTSTPDPTVTPLPILLRPDTSANNRPDPDPASGNDYAASRMPQVIVNEAFVLRSGSSRHYRFLVAPGAPNPVVPIVMGNIQVTGGSNDIWVGILDRWSFEALNRGGNYSLVYGQNIVGTHWLTCSMQPGEYYLVFSNKHSRLTDKGVRAFIRLVLGGQ